MNRLPIKYQILLITFIPAFLIDAYFTYSHISSSITQAQQNLQTKGRIITRQIAGASEFYIFSGNDQQIQYILDQTVGTDEIVLAAVYNNQGKLIAQAATEDYQSSQSPDYYYHYLPITSQSIIESDVFSPDQVEGPQSDTTGWVHIYFSRAQLEANKAILVRKSLVFFIFVLVMTLILTIVISRGITNPIYRLIEHLRKVETGQLGELVEPVQYNEIGALQRGFNSMTQALVTSRKHLNERIHEATQQLSQAVTHLETKNRELGFARDEAQHANKIKSQFLANMSHEIRTPINAIKGFINLIAQSELTPSQKRYTDIILKSTNELIGIIEEILDFSKLESGKLQIVDADFDLHEIIEQTRDILFINVINKNIDLILIIYSDTPRIVCGDRVRLRQVLLNIMGNAIKFTDEGEVVVRVQLEQQTDEQVDILITVEDSGIGISAEDQKELFQAFSQVESESNRRYSGTGLGLAISKNLVNLMGGDITMQSQPGKGSRFDIQIPFIYPANHEPDPLTDPALNAMIFASNLICLQEIQSLYDRAGINTEASLINKQSPLDSMTQVIQQNSNHINIVVIDLRHHCFDLNELGQAEQLTGTRVIVMHYDQSLLPDWDIGNFEFVPVITSGSDLYEIIYHPESDDSEQSVLGQQITTDSKKVLLVDDNQVNLTLGCELIKHWGHQAVAAEHAQEAIEQYRRVDFDLILLDIQMPDIDGLELLNMMREEKPDDSSPIVALTANLIHEDAKRLIQSGFDYYLSKPIDEEKLRAILEGEHPAIKAQRNTDSSTTADETNISMDLETSLSLCANNEVLLRQIFEILLREIPVYRSQLEKALKQPDTKKISLLAHKIHGVTCYAGLPRIRQLVIQLQQSIANKSSKDTSTIIRAIIDELDSVKTAVSTHLQTDTV